MRRIFLSALMLLAACGGGSSDSISSNPVSVRGWILDVKGAKRAESADVEIARRSELFASSSVWVENTQFASGGISGNGAFIILDVPPKQATIGFNAPGAETARVVLENIPGNADVFIPDLILEPNGATVLDPKKILIRVPASVDQPKPNGQFAKVAGYQVPVIDTPIHQLVDRRDYPNPGGIRPVATVR